MDMLQKTEVKAAAGAVAAAGLAYYMYSNMGVDKSKYTQPETITQGKCGGSIIAETLQQHGVKHIFTLCGGHISPILVFSKRLGIKIVDVRHEVTTAFAADVISRLTGVPGVAAVTAGPGITNTVTAIKNAQLAASPLILLSGAAPGILRGKGALQDIDQRALMAPHCKAFFTCNTVREVVPALQDAFRIAQEGVPGPVVIEYPTDVLYHEDIITDFYLKKRPPKSLFEKFTNWYLQRYITDIVKGTVNAPIGLPIPFDYPHATSGQASQVFNYLKTAKAPLFMVGLQATLGCKGNAEPVAQNLRKIGVPCYLTGMARGLLGRGDPTQRLHKRRDALREADVVVLFGVVTDFRMEYGFHVPGKAKLISVNRSMANMKVGQRTADVKLVGDPRELIEKLASLANQNPLSVPQDWKDNLQKRDDARNKEISDQAAQGSDKPGCNPVAVCQIVEKHMDENAIIVGDGGDFVGTAAYTVRPRGPLTWLDPGAFGTLGTGGGFALGASMARPGQEVWLLWGDGSTGFSLCEYDTFVRMGCPVISVIGNDACWSQICRAQMDLFDDDVGCALAQTDYHKAVEGFGAKGLLVTKIEEMEPAVLKAKEWAKAGNPVCINVHLQKSEFRKGSISM
eukprot:NODE_39_length_2174_cov_473.107474_g38_i0.p1 GENE.NODE_39_length_2174_cov_473.107474_g38_i0~~NODE_39_length_2174_cov_473.107474_g38_i0.p1  ORF type:complete len:626 (+),score=132.90 NODE_39_length_2174_cov_473.107474_g38_i0:61-1938(+)